MLTGGGVVVGSGFLCGDWVDMPPRPSQVLERTEVADVFTEARGWVTELDELVHDSDHGRTLLNFVAQRTASD